MSDLRKAAKMALDAIDVYAPDYMHALPKKTYVKALRAALAQPEPCADESDCDHMPWCRIRKICLKRCATPAQHERKPLTDEEIERIANSVRVDSVYAKKSTWHVRLIRAIEKAHGIE